METDAVTILDLLNEYFTMISAIVIVIVSVITALAGWAMKSHFQVKGGQETIKSLKAECEEMQKQDALNKDEIARRANRIDDLTSKMKIGKDLNQAIFDINDEVKRLHNHQKQFYPLSGTTLYLPYKDRLFYFSMYPHNDYMAENIRRTLDPETTAAMNFDKGRKMPDVGMGKGNDKVMNSVLFSEEGRKIGLLQYVSDKKFDSSQYDDVITEHEKISQLIYALNSRCPEQGVAEIFRIIPPENNNAVVMFCDITNSTKLLDMGIRDWVSQSIEFTKTIERVANKYGGRRFCSNQGDGTWIGFMRDEKEDEDNFLKNVKKATDGIIESFEDELRKSVDDGKIRRKYMHVSMYYGHVIAEKHGDLFDSSIEFYGIPFIRAYEGLKSLSDKKDSGHNEICWGNISDYIDTSLREGR